ncbi:MAG: ABC transporter substrate-binding protein [Pseudonocardiaceae bacterium]
MRLTVKSALAASLMVLGTAGLTGCGGASQPTQNAQTTTPSAGANAYPVTIRNCDKTYTYQRAPQRVVTGWPTTVDTLSDLGVGRSVAGYISGEFGPPPRDTTAQKLSDKYVPTTETILAAKPDFFLTNGDSQLSGESGSITRADLEKIDANPYVMGRNCKDFKGTVDVDAVYEDITNLGAIFGVPDKAKTLIDELRARVAAAKALRGQAQKPRVAYVGVFEDKLYALSGGTYGLTLDGIDAVNIFADLNDDFAEISPEKVLTLNPDAIVFEYYPAIETEAEQKTKVASRLGNSNAVRSGKVVGVSAHLSEGHGVAAIEAIELVAKGLYQ